MKPSSATMPLMPGEQKYRLDFLASLTRRRFLSWISAVMVFPGSGSPSRFFAEASSEQPAPAHSTPRVLRRRRTHGHGFTPFPDHAQTGTWGIGTSPCGPVPLLSKALRTGVTLVDTSPDYLNGDTELQVGQALKHAREPVFVITQLPVSVWGSENLENACHQALQQSLHRLGRDRIEALLIRNAGPGQIQNTGFRAFAKRAKDKGWVGKIGASGHGPNLEKILDLAVTDELLEIVLFGANLARFKTIPELLPRARRAGTLLVAMKTREAGLDNQVAGWERETRRRRHAPWNARWDPGFTRLSLEAVMAETYAHNAVVSLRHDEDIHLILGER